MFGINLTQTVFFILAVVLSIGFHEFFHAWSALQLGDPTARNLGRLTLNPVAHLDPIGALMIVFMAFSGFGLGWGKPVPVNPYNLRGNPRVSMALTSAAGPFSNLLLAALFAIPLRLVPGLPSLLSLFLYIMVFTNVSLALFNLIPLPPLDGFGVLQGVVSTIRTRSGRDLADTLDRFAPYGPIALLAILALGWFTPVNPLGWLLGPPARTITSLFLG